MSVELYKRNDKTASVDELSKEMKMDDIGTSMKSMADAAKKSKILCMFYKTEKRQHKYHNLM